MKIRKIHYEYTTEMTNKQQNERVEFSFVDICTVEMLRCIVPNNSERVVREYKIKRLKTTK